jgi:hypothetical protein
MSLNKDVEEALIHLDEVRICLEKKEQTCKNIYIFYINYSSYNSLNHYLYI